MHNARVVVKTDGEDMAVKQLIDPSSIASTKALINLSSHIPQPC